ncbi:MAG: hypothetical protein AAF652_19820 [Cyanobacteria bacterium P01_C01_bin.72]
MKNIFKQLLILTALLATGCTGFGGSSPEESEVEEGIDVQKNPIAAIQKAVELGKNIDDNVIANRDPVEPVSFKELLKYLPSAPQGWQAEEAEGETNSFANYSISQVSQAYVNGDKKMEVSIFDWAFNSALYTPFLLSTEFSQESTAGYNKGIKINDIPGREEFDYSRQAGSLNLLVNSRFLVQIDGDNIDEQELREWWKLVDYQSLNKI